MRTRVRAVLRGDREAGLGMILIIGVSVFVFTIAATAAAIAVNGIAQSRNRTGFEGSLALAETGIDRAMASVQLAYDAYGVDYPIPGPASTADPNPWCPGTAVSFPSSGEGANGVFSTEAAEKAWVLPRLEALVGTACTITDASGQYVVLKPTSASPKYGKIYSLAAMPSFAEAERTRVVKSEYIFMPYRPQHAILAGGNLALSSSTLVSGVDAAATPLAGVHSNGSITSTGNPTVYGPITSTNPSSATSTRFYGNAGNTVGTAPTVAVPSVNARQTRGTAPADARSTWYDLCPDGDVRAYTDPAEPCAASAPLIGTATGSFAVRGWTHNATTRLWTATRNVQSGTYYAHEGNVDVGTGNAVVPKLTVIASAQHRTDCANKRYGNITWDHYDMVAPSYGNIFLLADTDVVTTSNFTAGRLTPEPISGTFTAGDQMEMQTSSQGAVGSVVIGDQCPTPPTRGLITASEVKNPAVYFDPNAESPFSTIITTALWLDYGRG
jgi:hypothetical protein